MGIFQKYDFVSHAGLDLSWKIECDELTYEDYQVLADIVCQRFEFSEVLGIPRGGIPFAQILETRCDPLAETLLIVDDVYTTGTSMRDFRSTLGEARQKKYAPNIVGVPIFARKEPTEHWVFPVFTLWAQ